MEGITTIDVHVAVRDGAFCRNSYIWYQVWTFHEHQGNKYLASYHTCDVSIVFYFLQGGSDSLYEVWLFLRCRLSFSDRKERKKERKKRGADDDDDEVISKNITKKGPFALLRLCGTRLIPRPGWGIDSGESWLNFPCQNQILSQGDIAIICLLLLFSH